MSPKMTRRPKTLKRQTSPRSSQNGFAWQLPIGSKWSKRRQTQPRSLTSLRLANDGTEVMVPAFDGRESHPAALIVVESATFACRRNQNHDDFRNALADHGGYRHRRLGPSARNGTSGRGRVRWSALAPGRANARRLEHGRQRHRRPARHVLLRGARWR